MGIFDRFRRRQDESALPSEVDAYYKEERISRRSAALLLGVATFVITLLLGSALFFGGRAVYRAVNDDKNTENTTKVETDNGKNPDAAQPAPESTSESTNENEDTSPNVDVESDTNANSTNSTPSSGGTVTPALGDETTLPATGDPGM